MWRLVCVSLVVPLAAPGAEFTKVLLFAGQDRVRLSAVFQPSAEPGDLGFYGRITPAAGGSPLWHGPLGKGAANEPGDALAISNTVSGLRPQLWSPAAPVLYNFEITAERAGKRVVSKTVRFGFRSFEARNGQFRLNGKPVFLRGLAINPPGRGIPSTVGESRKFAADYVRFLKSQNVNILRLSTDESQVWFDICDELGMMLYAGRYGAPPDADEGKKAPPRDFSKSIAGYKHLFEACASHPSIVEYYLSNELPVSGARGAAFSRFLTQACADLKQWDDTRAYIGNAGYGEGREGDVCDVHRYWGWYYNSFLTYYNLRDRLYPRPLFGDPAKNQPLTFSECVGSFTGSSGQFNLVRSKQLAPSLGWLGHTDSPREDALAYQAFMVKQACESFRRMRPQNPRVAGLMPFTILFYNWSGVSSFDQMKPKPAMDALRTAYQPVLLSWECWTPQVYAGTGLRVIAHLINDDDIGRELREATLTYNLRSADGREYASGRIGLPTIHYYDTWSKQIQIQLPAAVPTGNYILAGSVIAQGQLRSTNAINLFIAGTEWRTATAERLYLYDPQGATARAFQKLGISCQRVELTSAWPAEMKTLVIGERVWDRALGGATAKLREFVRAGGRLLCLQPDPDKFESGWLPEKISFLVSSPNDPAYPPRTRPFREQMNANPERAGHPVFRGLTRKHLSLWSDYSAWDQTKPGFPKVYPVTTGYRLLDPGALARTAVLADYDRGLEGIALCEMFDGKGSVIVCGFDLVPRAGLDPAADRLLRNLAAYCCAAEGHEKYPLITNPVTWGNYATERGLVCGPLNGMPVNAEYVPAQQPSGMPTPPPNTGSWNMRPGEQFEPRGRNPFGPYGYSTAASFKDFNPDSKNGEGSFWARIPEGRKFLVTTVKNPASAAAQLNVYLGDQAKPGSVKTIPAGETTQVRTPLISNSREIHVRYAGDKTLVLLETAFE